MSHSPIITECSLCHILYDEDIDTECPRCAQLAEINKDNEINQYYEEDCMLDPNYGRPEDVDLPYEPYDIIP